MIKSTSLTRLPFILHDNYAETREKMRDRERESERERQGERHRERERVDHCEELKGKERESGGAYGGRSQTTLWRSVAWTATRLQARKLA